MSKKYWLLCYLIVLFVFLEQINGQSKASNATQEVSNFDRLRAKISTLPDSVKIQTLLVSLNDAKSQADTLAMADVYCFLSTLNKEKQLSYADSLISLTKGKGFPTYPALGYLVKGNVYFEKGNRKKALDFYLNASNSAKENGNESLYRTLKFNIGLLKNASGEREEAQIIFEEYLTFLKKNPEYSKPLNINKVLFALADSYIHSRELDKAKFYTNEGIIETLKVKDSTTYSYLVVTSGIHQYLSKKYIRAIDSLQKGKDLIKQFDKEETRVATCDYYIARSYNDLGDTETSIKFFKSVDRIFKETENVIPELMDTYNYLIKYSKSKQDAEGQIEYINTLLRLDSIKHADQLYLTKNINEKYDTVELIAEKEKLIDQLQEETFLKRDTILLLIIILAIVLALAIYGFRRSYLNKKRFERLLTAQKNRESAETKPTIITELPKKEELDIPKDVIATVLKKLQNFEQSDKFSKKHYTLNSLAKELQTNSAYLSKIINVYKNVNFANYLNNLRIDYAVAQLTENKSLRSYTIKAIAEEVGFKNAQSFSSAFYKKTGIYPSYFIKKISN
ncbi:hypothetical protein AWE51_16885 [Aquimarina aggregata]|uniref:HTH araC/xylS-type domain-containing protein n=1 Tax=Aquimarina aggregata TaxID=1642818 RepID=A0A163D5V4_9FLAO|nr:helix-turn-helix domain-containing protein [Aquimarina aggregata]KZS43018.1 hypothetical protein AWE51_16885 [Aquimarina aggregata]